MYFTKRAQFESQLIELTPERDKHRVEDCGWVIKQVCDPCIYTHIRQIPIRTSDVLITQRTHFVCLVTVTHLNPK